MSESAPLESAVAQAAAGDRAALEQVVRAIQPDIYGLALRFLWQPQDAEDATQEIMIRVITRLGTFRGESAFRTWVFRVATNLLLTTRKRRAEHSLSFDEFGADLQRGLSDEWPGLDPPIEHELLLEEVRIGCTLALLQCLDRPHRMAYILGEIIGLDHNEGAAAMELTPAAFRARVSRARRAIQSAMQQHCGLVDPANACRCRKRVKAAVELGRVAPKQLLFATSLANARAFPQVLRTIRELQDGQRAAALYRAQPETTATDFTHWIRDWLEHTAP